MKAGNSLDLIPVQLDDFADRVAAFQNLYKDLISTHPCAHVFEMQLHIVGGAISDLSEQAVLASLYGQATDEGRRKIMAEVKRVAKMSTSSS